MKLQPDLLAAKRWMYPLNHPKRDYQFNIVKHSLFENTLVALPTGLGKTFIAGVVMLNFYNWFPEGKVVFLAPSKPLVAQQIDACHRTCGIPGSQAAELTGETAKAKRHRLWAEKRVFYLTPQTLLSDLISENCDPRDIIFIVIDEAHKGTGDYAYAQVLRYMMAKNPHFRVLALTATPGSNPDAVQAIVDSLHISHIEIRDEESIDLRPYMHKKSSEQHIIKMDEDVVRIRDLLGKVMQPLIKQVQNNGAMRGSSDPSLLHPFRCQAAIGELRERRAPAWAMAAASKLGPLARAMGYLLEASTSMCYGVLNGIISGFENTSGKRSISRNVQDKLQKDPAFAALIKEVEDQKNRGFSLHPKMEKLRVLLVQHFAKHMLDKEEVQGDAAHVAQIAESSRVMVFVSFRECVDEVVEVLNKENPLIRATRFIGQGTDKQGRKGIAQREQLEVIQRFKDGEFNVLVSTSIGEEGLDIGEVDMIVCYDAQKTPIRMLQRVGRTGRKRDGAIHILLAEGREERNWDKAQDKYKDVQHFIVRAEQLELYGDVERLLPDHVKPECSELIMDIEEYIREDRSSRKGSLANGNSPQPKGKKRKRDDDPTRNIPAGAANGFLTVSQLLVKGGGSKKKSTKLKRIEEFDVLAGEDDDDDLEIEAGLFGPRKAASTSAASTVKKTAKVKHLKTIAAANDRRRPKARKKKKADEPTASQLENMGVEDSDDEEIQRGLQLEGGSSRFASPSTLQRTPSPPMQHRSLKRRRISPVDRKVIDITTPDPSDCENSPALSLNSSPDRPLRSRSTSTLSGDQVLAPLSNPSSSPRSASASRHQEMADMSWLIDDDEEPQLQVIDSSPLDQRAHPSEAMYAAKRDIDMQEVNYVTDLELSSPPRDLSPSPVKRAERSRRLGGTSIDMPPPALPSRLIISSPSLSDEIFPEPSFAIRAPGKQKKVQAAEDVNSSPLAMPPPSQRRLQRQRESPRPEPVPPPAKQKKRKFKDVVEAQKAVPWIDVEATHSGDERSVGSSDAEQPEDEYDRDFVQDLPETQVSPSYDQSAVYRRSLFTQAPGRGHAVPAFVNRPIRRGYGTYTRAGPSSHVRHFPSSSPRNDGDDYYELGSFIVDDEADISSRGHSSSEP
ncbi:hypothetical protein IEO21_00300 [Rhodonia placenta]|uniref:ATP-dependent DNA helicase n=1 Tax=Rhodonia placenta TaxID=104341 RepID=A0A8H7PBR2_9APHY|nr:hypothetical protein IEO21_00300 [Postia placenta]